MPWAQLPADLLRCVFAELSACGLLLCVKVCKRWNRIASEDSLWLRHLENRTRWKSEHGRLPASDYVGKLGELRMLDIYLHVRSFPPRRVQENYCELSAFVNFPYHPVRHGSISIGDLIRLARAWLYHPEALGSLFGFRFPHSPVLARRHRNLHYHGSVERQVAALLRPLVCAATIASAWSLYDLFSRPAARNSVPLLTLYSTPLCAMSILWPLLSPRKPTAAAHDAALSFFIIPWLALCGYQAGWALFTELWWQRIALVGLTTATAYLFGSWTKNTQYTGQAFMITSGVCLWRISLPSMSWLMTVIFIIRLYTNLVSCGLDRIFWGR